LINYRILVRHHIIVVLNLLLVHGLGSLLETVRKFVFIVLLEGRIQILSGFRVHRIYFIQVSFELVWDFMDAHVEVPEVLGTFVLGLRGVRVAAHLHTVHSGEGERVVIEAGRRLLVCHRLAIYQPVSSERAPEESFFLELS